ncbi:MAG: hypothetical protein U0Q11_25645 [Vicinamibacterales bacterium]
MTRDERAQLAWQFLVNAATNRQIVTYTMLADAIGMGAGTLAQVLGSIMYYCEQQDLPPLTALVVKKDTGIPGVGLTTLEDLASDRERVFSYEWLKMLPPSADRFRRAYETGAASELSGDTPAEHHGA